MIDRRGAQQVVESAASTNLVFSRSVALTQQSQLFRAGGSSAMVCPGVLRVPPGGPPGTCERPARLGPRAPWL